MALQFTLNTNHGLVLGRFPISSVPRLLFLGGRCDPGTVGKSMTKRSIGTLLQSMSFSSTPEYLPQRSKCHTHLANMSFHVSLSSVSHVKFVFVLYINACVKGVVFFTTKHNHVLFFWFGLRSLIFLLFSVDRCDSDTVGKSKEVELILSRLTLFLQGKWCLTLTKDATDEDRKAAEEEMKDWFAGAEQVRASAIVLLLLLLLL